MKTIDLLMVDLPISPESSAMTDQANIWKGSQLPIPKIMFDIRVDIIATFIPKRQPYRQETSTIIEVTGFMLGRN